MIATSEPGGFERLLAWLPKLGVTASALALALGLLLWTIEPGGVAAIRLLNAGLGLLLATPLLRLAVAVAQSLRRRDWLFVTSTIAVLLLIGVTLVLAFRATGR